MKKQNAAFVLPLSLFLALATIAFGGEPGTPPATVSDANGVPLFHSRSSTGSAFPYESLAAHVLSYASSTHDQAKGAGFDEATTVIQLTLHAQIQYLAETAMRESGVTRGAVVVMNPQNGDILALASFPNYDPNQLIGENPAQNRDALVGDPSSPLLNRALHAMSPSSTFKLAVALAGLDSGRVKADTIFDCPGSIQIGDHLFHNSDNTDAGQMTVAHAIEVSNDVFFYQDGIRTGIEAIDQMAHQAGFGQKWNVLGGGDEDAGIVPGPEWMKQNDGWLKKTHNASTWSEAQTANTSIGQGFVTVTPLQMTTFISAIANGGTVYRPRLVSRIEDAAGEVRPVPPPGQVFDTLGVKPADLKIVQQAMIGVVKEGTATLAQVPGVEVAGKTGTAQTLALVDGQSRRDVTTWFCCYAPVANPRYAITILVQGGTWGGTTSAPIAQRILIRLFELEHGQGPAIKPLPPVKANSSSAKPL